MLERSLAVQPGASNSVFVGLRAMGSLALMHIAASEGISRPGDSWSHWILLNTSERRDVHWLNLLDVSNQPQQASPSHPTQADGRRRYTY